MGLSIKQLAERAGVSRGTVDRALNNRPGINPAVKAQILRLAEAEGFRCNRAGRMLGLRKTPLKIGVQMPAQGNEFFLDVQRGLEQAAAELADYGLTLSVRTTKGYHSQTQIDQIRGLVNEGIHGLILVPIDRPEIHALLDQLAGQGLPVICCNTDVTSGRRLCYVGNDYVRSGRIAAGLLGLIADGRPFPTVIVTGSVQMLGHNQRVDGFNQVIRRNSPNITVSDLLENQDDDVLSYTRVRQVLAREPAPAALYLTAGGVAGACRALAEVRPARPVKLVCFDQVPGTRAYQQSGLITALIDQEPFRQGYESVRLLFEHLLDGTCPPPRVLTRNQIIIREHINHDLEEEPQ
jgi:LacI family transcriptional regulator